MAGVRKMGGFKNYCSGTSIKTTLPICTSSCQHFLWFFWGYAMIISTERKVIPFNGSLTWLTIFCITLYCPVKCQSKNWICAIQMCLILYDCVQILTEKGNKMVIYFYGSIYLVCFQNNRNMARKLQIFKNVLKHFTKTVKSGCWSYSEQWLHSCQFYCQQWHQFLSAWIVEYRL